jgi:hypothetical protein
MNKIIIKYTKTYLIFFQLIFLSQQPKIKSNKNQINKQQIIDQIPCHDEL